MRQQINLADYEAVAFDIDGTLARSTEVNLAAQMQAFAECGYDHIPFDQHKRGPEYGLSGADIIGGILCAAGVLCQQDRPFNANPLVISIANRRRELYEAAALAGFEAQPGAPALVLAVQQMFPGRTLFVTASPARYVTPFLTRYALNKDLPPELLVDEGKIRQLNRRPKPSPDPYNLAKELLNVKRMLVFEDTMVGVESAKLANDTVIAMGYDEYQAGKFAQATYCRPDYVVASAAEARALVGV